MRTVAVIFALALITIAFEIYSDAVLTRSEFSRPAPDPATNAVRAKAAREGLATSASKDRPGQALEGQLALSCGVIPLAALVYARAGVCLDSFGR
jgi:hypothetical protein